MGHPAIDLAKAVYDAIDAAELSQEFTAQRLYVPKYSPSSEPGYQIKIAPATDTREAGTLGEDEGEIVIHVGTFKKLVDSVPDELDEVDAAMDFCEEVRALFNRKRIGDIDWAICTKSEQVPLISHAELEEDRVFASVIALTFTVNVNI